MHIFILILIIVGCAAASAHPATAASPPSSSPSHHHNDHHMLHHSGRIMNQVSVKSYGAVGDGVTDDSSAIMNATAALVASGTSESENVLYFPVGRYLLSGPIPLSLSAYITIPSEAYYHYSVSGVSSEGTELIWQNDQGSLIEWQSGPGVQIGSSLSFTQMTITTIGPISGNGQMNLWASIGIETVNITDIVYNGFQPDDSIILFQVQTTATLTMSSCRGVNGSLFLFASDVGIISLSDVQTAAFGEPIVFKTFTENTNFPNCTVNIDNLSLINYFQGITLMTGASPYPSYLPFQVMITNSHFDATGREASLYGDGSTTVFATATGSLTVDSSTFIDPLHIVTHLYLETNSSLTLTNSTFSGGAMALQAQNGGEFTLSENQFIGPFNSSSIEITQPQQQAQSLVVNITNNVCSGINSTISLPSCNAVECHLANNHGC